MRNTLAIQHVSTEGLILNAGELEALLLKKEDPALDFKLEWYALGHADKAARNRQRDELVKDLLALANGSASTVGRVAHLVAGAADKLPADGSPRTLQDVGDLDVDRIRSRILKQLGSASEPSVPDIDVELLVAHGTRLLVLSVHPSPHLHETTRAIVPARGQYSERTVFIRSGEGIVVASAADRAAITRLKQIHFHELRNVPPVRFAAFVGSMVGLLAVFGFRNQLPPGMVARIAALPVAAAVGGLLGALVGRSYDQLAGIVRESRRFSPLVRYAVLAGISLAGLIYIGWLASLFVK